jgi:hypothetical protein
MSFAGFFLNILEGSKNKFELSVHVSSFKLSRTLARFADLSETLYFSASTNDKSTNFAVLKLY